MTPEERAARRQKLRDELASKKSVQLFLRISEVNGLVNAISAFVVATTVLFVGRYSYETLLLLYKSIVSSKSDGLLNFAVSTIIIATTYIGIKSQGIDGYIQREIIDTLFVMRNDAIVRGDLVDVLDVVQKKSKLIFKSFLNHFEVTYKKPKKSNVRLLESSDEDEAFEEHSEEEPLVDTSKEEPTTSKSKSKSTLRNWETFSGVWKKEEDCTLFQFQIQKEEQESVFLKLNSFVLAKLCPPSELWAEKATLKEQPGKSELQIQKTKTLSEAVLEAGPGIKKQKLTLMKLYAEHVANLHNSGLFGNFSLAKTYVVEDHIGSLETIAQRMTSFSPDWIDADPLTKQEKNDMKKQEVFIFGTILLEVLLGVKQDKIIELKSYELKKTKEKIPREPCLEELYNLATHEPGTENLKNLLFRIFVETGSRPTMDEVARILAQCCQERASRKQSSTKKSEC